MNYKPVFRENELLKHQLKKYVGAVQALRSDSHGTSSEAMEGEARHSISLYIKKTICPGPGRTSYLHARKFMKRQSPGLQVSLKKKMLPFCPISIHLMI